MSRSMLWLALAAGLAVPAGAASLTAGAVFDGEGGEAYDLDGRFSPTADWSIAAGAGHSASTLDGERFSGTSLRLSSDAGFGPVLVAGSVERFTDSSRLRSTLVQAELGWISDSGLALTALFADRSLRLDYDATVLGETRERQIDFNGTGFGADLSWFGRSWSVGLRLVDYDYGRSMNRVRAVLASPGTQRFPRLQLLVDSVVTRMAGAPEREIGFSVAREFARSSLRGEWFMQRDALTGYDVHSVSLTLGRELAPQLSLDVTAGVSDGSSVGTMAHGGLALTFSTAP